MGLRWCNFLGFCLLEFTGCLPPGVGESSWQGSVSLGALHSRTTRGSCRGGFWPPGAAHPSARNQQLAPEGMLASQEPSPEQQPAPSDGGHRGCAHEGVACWGGCPHCEACKEETRHASRMPGRQRALQEPAERACWNREGRTSSPRSPSPVPSAKSSIMLADKKTKIFKGPSSILAKQVRKIHLEVGAMY